VFVTGNAEKLREVREILAQQGAPIDIESRDLDREWILHTPPPFVLFYDTVTNWHGFLNHKLGGGGEGGRNFRF
jgi:hypothetical protein